MRSRTRPAFVLALLSLLAGGMLSSACHGDPHASESSSAVEYFCAMHPQIVRDQPGTCPICSMKLVPRAKSSPTSRPGARTIAFYRHPMDPNIHSDKPAKDAMGMDYVPVYEDERAGGTSGVAGRETVTLTPEKRQMLNVHSEEVKEAPIERTVRTVGRVAVDERHIHHYHAKYEGYVENLYVDFTGKLVKAGDPLLSIYSPELVATQEEYLVAFRNQTTMGQSRLPSVAQGAADLLAAARQRLLLWDIAPKDIERLERTGEARKTLDLYAVMGGYVLEKTAFHGMRVMPNDTLFKIADLSQVWILAEVYEHDLPAVKPGATAEITAASDPGRKWTGPVTFIAPIVDPRTRTVEVRVEVGNRDATLKPDMYTEVLLHSPTGRGLVIPGSAVVEAGDRQLVFVDRGEGGLEPRTVVLGGSMGDQVQVVSGVASGERVVTSASFLIDSESSLKAALATLARPAASPRPEPRP
jgi:Cu(I)/Ag(I) efflux system membrane fusion protein/cobalt-zinc-cadmium efflux system membrane fusion protein